MKYKFLKSEVIAGLLIFNASAHATLIDFEDVTVADGGHIIVNEVVTGDFKLSREGTSGHIDVGSATEIEYVNNGTQIAYVHNGAFTMNLDTISGETFEIDSFSGAEFWRDTTPNATTITLMATDVFGMSFSEVFTLDQVFDGPGGINDFQEFTVSNTFENLVTAKFVGEAAFAIDNILGYTASEPRANTVPEPSSLYTFIFVIMGLATRKFNKRLYGG